MNSRNHINMKCNSALLLSGVIAASAFSAETPLTTLPPPTAADVPYGTHARQKLDFYKAKSGKPTPVLFVIHGGGWTCGDKGSEVGLINPLAYLNVGISIVSINYRYVWQAQQAGVKPPVKAPLEDAARALQLVRSKAKEWNLDKARICVMGGSAGGCSSLWLTFHDDMADSKSADPVARESTRPLCAAVLDAQTSLDPKQMKEWTPNSRYGGHAFGFERDTNFDEFLAHREELLPWIMEYSPYELVTKGDPPVYLIYTAPPRLGRDAQDPTHTANFGVKFQERCQERGVECELVYPGAPNVKHVSLEQYILAMLGESKK